jgi:hypothetical protein
MPERPVPASEDLFWRLANDLLALPGVTRSTMMGYPCLRMNGHFFACLERTTGNLVVKLPADRVNDLVSSGPGISFAPNRRVFREWVALPIPDEDEWSAFLEEARTFVNGCRLRLGVSTGTRGPSRSSSSTSPTPLGVNFG